MIKEPKFQHIIPRTYLKRFQIDETENKNKVWCLNLIDKYKKEPQNLGVNHKLFKIKHFYTYNQLNNKYDLELFFANQVEPILNIILNEVNSEVDLSEDVRKKIFEWVFYSKQRSEHLRKLVKNTTQELTKMIVQFDLNKNKSELSIDYFADEIENYSKQVARDFQFNIFFDRNQLDKQLELFWNHLISNKWTIFKTTLDYSFITSDNPGFSLNWTKFYQKKPFHSIIHLGHPSFNFFVLSPQYCLFISPFKSGTNLKYNALNTLIEYELISKSLVGYINYGSYYTSHRLLISNDKQQLDKWVK